MTRPTDRYVLSGGPVPRIYHGTLAMLAQAVKDAGTESRFRPGVTFLLKACKGGERRNIAVFKDGECTYRQETEAGR
jgi:hypothetical protein